MVRVQQLAKHYGTKAALQDITFSIEQGEILGILGLNGAGKSSLLRILSGLSLPTSGAVFVDGVDVVADPLALRACIGYLPDQPPIYGEMSVRAFLEFAARLRGMAPSDVLPRVKQVAEQTGLAQVSHRRIGELSYGYRQRLGIAQAIIHEPKLVLLDEPMQGLDPAQAVEMRALVRSLRQKLTVILSSHLLSEVSQICDRILVIHEGRVLTHGAVPELATGLHAHKVVVRVRGDGKAALEVLRGVARVQHIAVQLETQDQTEFLVDLQPDGRAEVCKALVLAGLEVIRIDRQLALESLFLSLFTRSHPAAPPATPPPARAAAGSAT